MPNLVAGFSFGIYAALYAADAISYESGLTMLREAYLLMDEESHGKDYGMGIIVGLEHAEIYRLLAKKTYRTLCVVNSSNDTCYILSGTKPELRAMLQEAMERDAYSAEVLEVDIAYHHPTLLGEVSVTFAEFIHGLEWTDPACPVVSSIDQTLLKTAADLKDFAARNLTTPINWKQVVRAMERAGVTRIIECGPGVSLTQNGRFISSSMAYTNIKKARRWLQV
jgi:[acyl-carrier-protein] S-malonyltransferase